VTESDLEQLFRRAQEADPDAAEQLFALLYDELHRLAEHHLHRGNSALTIGTTTLVHEAYLNMVGRTDVSFPDRQRFFAYASRAMRGLVIDFARRRCAKKRGRMLGRATTARRVGGCGARCRSEVHARGPGGAHGRQGGGGPRSRLRHPSLPLVPAACRLP